MKTYKSKGYCVAVNSRIATSVLEPFHLVRAELMDHVVQLDIAWCLSFAQLCLACEVARNTENTEELHHKSGLAFAARRTPNF